MAHRQQLLQRTSAELATYQKASGAQIATGMSDSADNTMPADAFFSVRAGQRVSKRGREYRIEEKCICFDVYKYFMDQTGNTNKKNNIFETKILNLLRVKSITEGSVKKIVKQMVKPVTEKKQRGRRKCLPAEVEQKIVETFKKCIGTCVVCLQCRSSPRCCNWCHSEEEVW